MPSRSKTPGSRSRVNPLRALLRKIQKRNAQKSEQLDLEKFINSLPVADLSEATGQIVNELRAPFAKTCVSPFRITSQSASVEKSDANISSQPVEVGRRKFLKFEKDHTSQT